MPDTKISGLTAASSVAVADQLVIVQGGTSKVATAVRVRSGLVGSSIVAVSAGYAADTYLAGSSLSLPSNGMWTATTIYTCVFDMTKTGAGTAAFTVTLRMGSLGTTGDASIAQLAFGAGTAAIDTGIFTVLVNFRSVGSGTSAVIATIMECRHHLAATGLVSTGASGIGIISATSGGFNSTISNIIGISVNGGASFSGTNTIVQSALYGF